MGARDVAVDEGAAEVPRRARVRAPAGAGASRARVPRHSARPYRRHGRHHPQRAAGSTLRNIMRDTLPSLPEVEPFVVDGAWIDPAGRELFDVIDPATEVVMTQAVQASAEDVDNAVAAALRAHRDRRWSGMSPHDRARILGRVADLIEEHLEELAVLET